MKNLLSLLLLMVTLGSTPVNAQDYLTYVAVDPCRIVDTREDGVLLLQTISVISVYPEQWVNWPRKVALLIAWLQSQHRSPTLFLLTSLQYQPQDRPMVF